MALAPVMFDELYAVPVRSGAYWVLSEGFAMLDRITGTTAAKRWLVSVIVMLALGAISGCGGGSGDGGGDSWDEMQWDEGDWQ